MKQESLTLSEFRELAKFIYDKVGIHMNDGKKTLLETRIRKRMQKLQHHDFSEYKTYLFSPQGMTTELELFFSKIQLFQNSFKNEPRYDFGVPPVPVAMNHIRWPWFSKSIAALTPPPD